MLFRSFTVQNFKRTRKDILFTPRNLLLLLSQAVPKNSAHIAEIVNNVKLGIIFNGMRSSSDRETAALYQLVIKNSYGFETGFAGDMAYSDVITSSIQNMKPVVTFEKNGEFVDSLDNIASFLSQQFIQKKGAAL